MSVAPLLARELGARGSRAVAADGDPAGLLSPAAARLLAALHQWWQGQVERAGLDDRWADLALALDTDLPSYDEPPLAEAAALTAEQLGAAYAAALTPAVRARHGRHYTPPLLAAHLWKMARSSVSVCGRDAALPGLVRDRACGGGALLLPALRDYVGACADRDPAIALNALPGRICGVDADPHAVWLANVVLAAQVLPLLAAQPARHRRPLPILARVGDGLENFPDKARVELLNPPYGRVRLSVEDRQRWAHVLYGHANLYGLFLAAALEGLDEHGVVAALVPTSFTSGRYFSRLRACFSARAPLRSAAFMTERDGVFTDVLQETCLAVFDRRPARQTSIVSLDRRVEKVAKVRSPRGDGPWLLPRRPADATTAASAATMPVRLADLGYRCSTGPLVWNRRTDDLVDTDRRDAVTVVWAADIDDGSLHRDPRRDATRFLRLRPGDEPTLVLADPAVLVQRTTAPEQTRRLVVADLTRETLREWGGRVVVENHVNVLRPTVASPVLDRSTLAAVLRTATFDRVVRSVSGSVALSAYELNALPFPDVEVLRGWNGLTGEALEHEVASAYQPGL